MARAGLKLAVDMSFAEAFLRRVQEEVEILAIHRPERCGQVMDLVEQNDAFSTNFIVCGGRITAIVTPSNALLALVPALRELV